MVSVKDYAAKSGVSLQTIYAQIKRKSNAKHLEGHIIRQNGVMCLDDYAVLYLDSRRDPAKRSTKHTVVIDHDKEDLSLIADLKGQIAEYERRLSDQKTLMLQQKIEYSEEINALKVENAAKEEQLKGQETVIAFKDEQLTYLRQQLDTYALISDELKNKEIRISAQDRELEDLRKQLDAELNKGFFARLFRK